MKYTKGKLSNPTLHATSPMIQLINSFLPRVSLDFFRVGHLFSPFIQCFLPFLPQFLLLYTYPIRPDYSIPRIDSHNPHPHHLPATPASYCTYLLPTQNAPPKINLRNPSRLRRNPGPTTDPVATRNGNRATTQSSRRGRCQC